MILIYLTSIILSLVGIFAILYYDKYDKKKYKKSELIYKSTKTDTQAIHPLDKIEDLTKENKELQLKATRFDLNFHLFKNALNKLKYSTEKKEESFDIIIDILNYVLYDSNKENHVQFVQEYAFFRTYLSFYELTFENVKIEIINNIEDTDFEFKNHTIAPLMTTYFVENAFKHGHIDGIGNDVEILFDYDENTKIFTYSVKNKLKDNVKKINNSNSGSGKINIEKRLKDLYPINGYNLHYKNESGKYYIATLTINFK